MNFRPVIVFVFAAVLTACDAEAPRDATLPSDMTVTTPGENVPAEYAAFSGVWSGTWGDCLPGKLAVTSVEPSGAVTTIYSFGDCAEWGISAGATEYAGQIEDQTLRLERFGNGAQVEYTLNPDGTLAGTYVRDGSTTRGTFRKI